MYINKMVARLPDQNRQVFVLYVIEGYSHKEIAEQMGMSDGTSKWHLSVGRKMLREMLEKIEGIEEKLNKMVI